MTNNTIIFSKIALFRYILTPPRTQSRKHPFLPKRAQKNKYVYKNGFLIKLLKI